MGRLSIIKYQHTPDNQFFMCRSCRTHIALREDYLYKTQRPNSSEYGGIFEKAVNLLIDSPANHRREDNDTYAGVFCVTCNWLLGVKCIQAEQPSEAVQDGRFLLTLNTLLYWDGYDQLEADMTD